MRRECNDVAEYAMINATINNNESTSSSVREALDRSCMLLDAS